MSAPVLRLRVDDAAHFAVLTLDRPQRRNAVDCELLSELRAALEGLGRDPRVRAVVLTGASGTFCAGADITAMRSLDLAGTVRFLADGQALTALIAALPIPVVAAIEGFALGGGLELALACDIRIAGTSAVMALPEVRVGAIPAWGGTQRLARLVGPGVALDLVLTGRHVQADEALRLGLVHQVCPPGDVLPTACARAAEMARASPVAMRAAKAVIQRGVDLTLDDGLAAEADAARVLAAHPDHAEGIEAFLEKRAPRWGSRDIDGAAAADTRCLCGGLAAEGRTGN